MLSNKSRLIELGLYVNYIHKRHFHASGSFMLTLIRNKFWIVGGITSLVKRTLHECKNCVAANAETVKQLMADLPNERVTISRPFAITGVDLSGAFSVKYINHRSTKFNKVYIAFFVCFCIRAVYRELVENPTTEAFIAALERFVSRRGLPHTIYSDNGTNFVGAANVFEHSKKIANFASANSIKWQFIAPRSPHQGGIWEAAVRAGKVSLAKAIGNLVLNFTEFNTVPIKVEAISRSIAYKNVGRNSEPLTPGHFLIGTSLFEIPIADNPSVKLETRFRLFCSIINLFWRNWRSDYLSQLQTTRVKWKERSHLLTMR